MHQGTSRASHRPLRFGFSRSGVDVVTLLIGTNLGVFVLQQIATGMGAEGGDFNSWIVYTFGLSADGLRSGFLWQPVTHLFLHGGDEGTLVRLLHLALNMALVHAAGKALVPVAGNLHVAGIYFSSGVLSGLAQILLLPESLLVGASGAAFGLLLAFATLVPEEELTAFVLAIPFHLRARTLGRALLISNAAFTGLVQAAQLAHIALPILGSVAHAAHLAGSVCGWLYVRLFLRRGADPGLTHEELRRQRAANDERLEQLRSGIR